MKGERTMTAEMRMNEILDSMHYCSKNLYRRDEMLSEMNGLEKEMVNITFNCEQANQDRLWIRDVEDHLAKINEKKVILQTKN